MQNAAEITSALQHENRDCPFNLKDESECPCVAAEKRQPCSPMTQGRLHGFCTWRIWRVGELIRRHRGHDAFLRIEAVLAMVEREESGGLYTRKFDLEKWLRGMGKE